MADQPSPIPFSLIPEPDTPISPDDQLGAAVRAALGGVLPDDPEFVEPIGRSWMIDPARGGFVRRGLDPIQATGDNALRSWCLMAVHTERFAHRIFTDQFGVEGFASSIGKMPDEGIAQRIGASLVRALLRHDRIAAVEDVEVTFDSSTGIISLNTFTVVKDDESRLYFGDIFLATTNG